MRANTDVDGWRLEPDLKFSARSTVIGKPPVRKRSRHRPVRTSEGNSSSRTKWYDTHDASTTTQVMTLFGNPRHAATRVLIKCRGATELASSKDKRRGSNKTRTRGRNELTEFRRGQSSWYELPLNGAIGSFTSSHRRLRPWLGLATSTISYVDSRPRSIRAMDLPGSRRTRRHRNKNA